MASGLIASASNVDALRKNSLGDEELGSKKIVAPVGYGRKESVVLEEEIGHVYALQQSNVVLRTLNGAEQWLDRKLGVEVRGINRIPEEEKEPPSIINTFLFWFSLNLHVGVVPLGILAPEFGLSLGSSVGATVIGTVLGALCTAYTGTLGPRLGLRAIATSRYSFGFHGSKLCSFLNVIVGGGFAVVNFVVVGQVLSAVSNYTMTISVGIVIIAILSYAISIFGFKIIHTYEKYSWIPAFILFWVLTGQISEHVEPSAPGSLSGIYYAGAYLTILSINFSGSSGWCSIASDYYCNYPASTPSWKIFVLTFFGIVIPTTISTTVGNLLGNAAITAAYGPYADEYESHGLGGLLHVAWHPNKFSNFCLIISTLGVLGNNTAIMYSSGLSLQLLGTYFHAIPRFVWSLVVDVVITILAVVGKDRLSTVVANFVSLLGYWTVSFTVILLIEDKYFRRTEGYDLTAWNQPDKLPWGVAAVVALLAGYLGGGVPGMAQTWYVGPVAAHFGEYGGDVGVYMSGVITLLVYPLARTIEKKKVGR